MTCMQSELVHGTGMNDMHAVRAIAWNEIKLDMHSCQSSDVPWMHRTYKDVHMDFSKALQELLNVRLQGSITQNDRKR